MMMTMTNISYQCILLFSFFQLVDVDVIAGLDMMVQRGQWDKAIETAEQQVHRTAFSILASFNNRGDVLPCENQNLNNKGTGLNSHIYFFANGFMPV